MTNLPTAEVTDTLAAAADTLYEIPAGFTSLVFTPPSPRPTCINTACGLST
jgi:hypothetical protein